MCKCGLSPLLRTMLCLYAARLFALMWLHESCFFSRATSFAAMLAFS